jgi:hypothetical protein
MGSLGDEQRALEQALNRGQVEILGDGQALASRQFVESLGALPPCARRLAIARACIAPWRADPEHAPDGYRQALVYATAEAVAEYGSLETVERKLDGIGSGDSLPINEFMLRQLAPRSPLRRYRALLVGFEMLWFEFATEPPSWLSADEEYVTWIDRAPKDGLV